MNFHNCGPTKILREGNILRIFRAVPEKDEQSALIYICRSVIFPVSARLYFTNLAGERRRSTIQLLTAVCNAAAEYDRPLHAAISRDSLKFFKFDGLFRHDEKERLATAARREEKTRLVDDITPAPS